jgi:transcription elongation GreA/GreB family factor
VNKTDLIDRHRAQLTERAASLRALRNAAREGTRVDEGHRPTNRGERAAVTSQAYLADGLQARLEAVEHSLAVLERLEPGPRQRFVAGALARVVDEEGRERVYLLLPGGQGDALEGPDGPVTVLSPEAPIARALAGLEEGDAAELTLGGRDAELEIVGVE